MNKQVLIYLAYPQESLDVVEQECKKRGYRPIRISPNDQEGRAKAIALLPQVDIAFIGSPLPLQNLESSSAKWIHFDWVGVEGQLSTKLLENHVVTNGSGRNSICLAEHVFFFIFSLAYGVREILASQHQAKWKVGYQNPYESLYGKTIMILGTGSIGMEVARRAHAFGMHTIGYARRRKLDEEQVLDEQYVSPEGLVGIERADFIVNCLSCNNETYHLMNAKMFQRMKKSAYFINISRGAVVDEKALIEALQAKQIAGAASDVFEQEPLPEESPLWRLDNMLITPHHSPQSPLKFEIGVQTILTNLAQYECGGKLKNQQTEKDVVNH